MPTRRGVLTSMTIAMFGSLMAGALPAGARVPNAQRATSPPPQPRGSVKSLGVPVCSGAMIGHVDRQFTLPLGVQVELDADAGTITMLESAAA